MMIKSFSVREAASRLVHSTAALWCALAALLAVSTVHSAAVQSVSLTWDANSDAVTRGYFLYTEDAAGNPLSRTDVGNTTTASVSGLVEGNTYFFYITAYDAAAVESAPSNEVSYSVPLPPNGAPTATSKSLSTLQDQSVPVVLSGSDPNGDPLTFSVVSTPTHGSLSGSAPNLTYSPASGFYGSDSFTFKASDGKASSAAATVSITVQHVNHAPVANSLLLAALEDVAGSLTLTGSDSDGDALTFTVLTSPTKGSLTGTAPNLVYTPAANVSGTDSFTYKASDAALSSAAATVTINIAPVNDAPVASAKSATTAEDQPVNITLSGSDIENDALTFSVVAAPAKGSLSGTAPNLVYTPAANATGTDSFTYKASDASSSSAPVTVSITITPVNDAPVASPLNVSTLQDQTAYLTLNASDIDGNALTFSIVNAPIHGTVGGTAPNYTYTPAAGYFGSDSFTYKVSDGSLNSATATVSITIQRVNKAPVASALAITTNQGQSSSLTLAGSDPDGDSISYTIVAAPAKGTLSGTAPNLTYVPAAGYSGSDSFTYKVSDGSLSSAIATVSITILKVNQAPVASALSITATEDQAVNLTLSGSDAEGSALSYTIVSSPARGTLSGTAPNLVYTPSANVSGSDSFTYRVSDGSLSSATATVNINITAVNDAPVASAASLTTAAGQSASLTLSGSDVDGDALTYSIVTGPAKGALSGTAPNLTYTPASGYSGSDSFTFKVSDGKGGSSTTTVTITVTGIANSAPVAQSRSVTSYFGFQVNFSVSATDADGDSLTYTALSQPSTGTLTKTGTRSFNYKPASGFKGTTSFTFTASDGKTTSAPATVTINVR